MNYKELEEKVYQILSKDIDQHGRYFSLRIQSHKNDPNGRFIGTEKSGYFKFYFWHIPIYFEGSSGNFLDFVVFKNKSGWSFKFEGSIPRKVNGDQNNLSLMFLDENIDSLLNEFKNYKVKSTNKKTRAFSINAKEYYNDIDRLIVDLNVFTNLIILAIDKRIALFKREKTSWDATRFVKAQWDEMHELYHRRIARNSVQGVEDTINVKEMDLNASIERRKYPLNQILYGPPGTGKTYKTVTLALDILGVDYDTKNRKDTVTKYQEQVGVGNIVFTTFHQSMSYEDFVEGIKPVMHTTKSEDSESKGEISYEVKPGILMTMAANAAYDNHMAKSSLEGAISFDFFYDEYIAMLESKIKDGTPHVVNTKQGLPLLIPRINTNDSIITQYKHSVRKSRSRPKTKDNLRTLFSKIRNIDDVKNVKDLGPLIGTRGGMSGYWAVYNDFLRYAKTIDNTGIDTEDLASDQSEIVAAFKSGAYSNTPFDLSSPRKVLIIDEINRGNVSAIFGELITLLEEDKRIGEENQVTSSLPNSPHASFGLPPNLHIIGTMNTADRSVEALDTALRRRFSFREISPNPKVLDGDGSLGLTTVYGHKLSEILEVINSRVEALIDRDHTIGHSYFMHLEEEEDVIDVFTDKIVPLLQEYFYNDYSKIEMVLGSGFVGSERNSNSAVKFAKQVHVTEVDLPEVRYHLITIDKQNIQSALDLLMNIDAK